MRLILVRHGQTPCNVANIWHGWDDCGLTEEGLAQARAVGARLAGEQIEAVYTSDLRRAVETARSIAAPHNLVPILESGLRERMPGEYEGVPMAEIEDQRPTIWQERNADPWGWQPPGGETLEELASRGLAVVERLATAHAFDTVVAVSHMGMVRVLISRLAKIPLLDTFGLPFPSTGISVFRLAEGVVEVETLNDAAHLE